MNSEYLVWNNSFLFRKEPFGGIGLDKDNENYFYLTKKLVRILFYVEKEKKVKKEVLAKKFKISEKDLEMLKKLKIIK